MRFAPPPPLIAALLSWLGLGGIAAAVFWYDHATPFPGVAAALPVLGTAMVIVGGSSRVAASRVLSLAPVNAIGRASYGWYLWHWPVLIIIPSAAGLGDSVWVKAPLALLALLVAMISLRVLENPIRHAPALTARPVRAISLGLSFSAAAVAFALATASLPRIVPAGAPARELAAAVGQSGDPLAIMRQFIADSATRQVVPSNLRPSLSLARDDLPPSYADGCHLQVADTEPRQGCWYGETGAATTVVLFGDSHAAQWLPALIHLAHLRHWRVLSLTKSSCGPADVLTYEESLKRAYTECAGWRERAVAQIRDLAPALVVTSAIVDDRPVIGQDGDAAQAWLDGWRRTFGAIGDAAARIVLVADTPYARASVPDCVAQNPAHLGRCAVTAEAGIRLPQRRAQLSALAGELGVTVVDPLPWMCDGVCPPVIGDVLVFRDAHHVTTEFAVTVSPLLLASLPPIP
jgi:hypothetical protein